MLQRLSISIGDWIATHLESLAQGDKVWFDCSMNLVPMQNGQVVPVVVVVIFLQGAILDTVHWGTRVVNSPTVMTEEQTTTMLAEMLEELRRERTKTLQIAQNGNLGDQAH